MYLCDVPSGKKDIITEILFDINLINTKGTQKNHHLVCEIYSIIPAVNTALVCSVA